MHRLILKPNYNLSVSKLHLNIKDERNVAKMHNFIDKYSKGLPVVIIGMLLVLAVAVTLSLGGEGSKNVIDTSAESVDSITGEADSRFLGVVKDINTDIHAITIIDIEDSSEKVLYFNGGTDISDKYGKIMSMSQINLGEMVDTYYIRDENKLVKMQISNDAWEYKGVGNLKINSSEKVMKITDTKYQYTEKLVIANDGKLVGLIDINDKDELTIKGAGKKIWSILVTKGHGYIRLSNYDAFIDGAVEVGYDIFMPVSKDMLIVAREGNYKITLENGNLKGSKQINVVRNREILVDMSEYKKEAVQISDVYFEIDPFGALLYVDGKETDYAEPVSLTYGNHDIKVNLGGYKGYAGTLFVNESSMTIPIILADQSKEGAENAGSAEEDGSNEDTPVEVDPEEESNVIGQTPDGSDITLEGDAEEDEPVPSEGDITPVIDTDHKIYVEAPIGAEVYFDGNLKGTVPCSFTKQTGNHTITFRKSGYETKSYSIEVSDNDEDIKLDLPEMAPLS